MTTDDETIFQEICRLLQPFNKQGIDLKLTTDMTTDMQIIPLYHEEKMIVSVLVLIIK